MTTERSTGTPVGFRLLNHIQGESFIQVGFALLKLAWGHGYGTEMAAAVLRYGFIDLALPHIVAMANLENRASQHVLQKIGRPGSEDPEFTGDISLAFNTTVLCSL